MSSVSQKGLQIIKKIRKIASEKISRPRHCPTSQKKVWATKRVAHYYYVSMINYSLDILQTFPALKLEYLASQTLAFTHLLNFAPRQSLDSFSVEAPICS